MYTRLTCSACRRGRFPCRPIGRSWGGCDRPNEGDHGLREPIIAAAKEYPLFQGSDRRGENEFTRFILASSEAESLSASAPVDTDQLDNLSPERSSPSVGGSAGSGEKHMINGRTEL